MTKSQELAAICHASTALMKSSYYTFPFNFDDLSDHKGVFYSEKLPGNNKKLLVATTHEKVKNFEI